MKEDRHVMLLDFEKEGNGSDGIQLKSNRWNADGFVMVRGIKD